MVRRHKHGQFCHMLQVLSLIIQNGANGPGSYEGTQKSNEYRTDVWESLAGCFDARGSSGVASNDITFDLVERDSVSFPGPYLD